MYQQALQQSQSSFAARNDNGAADILEWAREAYANGDLTEEEFDSYVDLIMEQESLENASEPAEVKYSISPVVGQKADYGIGVKLDTDLFDGVHPRYWGVVLGKYVYENLAGTELIVYDEDGNEEVISFARTNDRVQKDGAKNRHKVIDELARYRGDNIKALATVHISELLRTSRYENTTDDNEHQWLDQNGWEHRKTYIEDRNGSIYEATLNIANGRDRRILYAINNIRKIDEKRDTRGAVPSTENGRGSLTKGISTGDTVAENAGVVNAENSQEPTFEEQYGLKLPSLDNGESTGKRKFSISPSTIAKQDVISDLRGILQRGGDPAELRRYVARMEQSTQNPERNDSFAYQNAETTEQILGAAKRQGISVSQYLQENWEQYEVDGQWNAAARQALDQERGGRRRYSISETKKETEHLSNSPLTRRSVKQRSVGSAHEKMSSTAAAKILSIENISNHSDSVKNAVVVLGEFFVSVEENRPVLGFKKAITASNLEGSLIAQNVLKREGSGGSAYRYDDGHALRVSNHSAKADNFIGEGEHLSITLFERGKMNDFVAGEKNVIEAVFRQRFLDNNPEALKRVIYDIAHFITEGEYHDTAGALHYNLSGSKEFKEQATQRLQDDRIKRENKLVIGNESESARYSISPNPEQAAPKGLSLPTLEENTGEEDLRAALPAKAMNVLQRTERTLLNSISKSLSVPWYARREFLQTTVQEISNSYLRDGTVDHELIDQLFEDAYQKGIVVDTEFYNQYKHIKQYLRTTPVTISQQDQSDIADFHDFKTNANRYKVLRIAERKLTIILFRGMIIQINIRVC